MTPILSKPYYRSELDLLPTKSTNPETTNWRCLMASEGNGFTHYLVSKGVVLGEACIIEQCLLLMINRHSYSVSQTIIE